MNKTGCYTTGVYHPESDGMILHRRLPIVIRSPVHEKYLVIMRWDILEAIMNFKLPVIQEQTPTQRSYTAERQGCF